MANEINIRLEERDSLIVANGQYKVAINQAQQVIDQQTQTIEAYQQLDKLQEKTKKKERRLKIWSNISYAIGGVGVGLLTSYLISP